MAELLVGKIHEETSRLERLHGVKFDDQALLLAAYVAMHPRNQSVGEVREKAIDVLNKACKTKDNIDIYQKQLHRLKYTLRRALVEFKQLIKENNVDGSRDSWVFLVEKELKDAFIDLVMFMNKRMSVKHDDFVSCVHEAERVQDYSHILQVDGRFHEKFKEKLVIGVQEIAEIASNLTGIPASWFCSKPEERYTSLGERLRKRIFGQDQAIEAITEALLRPKAESSWSGRPLGFFLLVGPYAVGGRTEFVKAIASELYDDDEDRLIKIDMEKYMEPHSASYLVDSLTHSVKNKPYSVLLFDRIEKAHACVIDTLLSILSSKNNSIDFRNTLIILTSDVEEEAMQAPVLGPGFADARKSIKHEFFELLDKTIMVNWRCPLKDIARFLLREWACKCKKPVIVCPSDSALTQIALKAAREEGANGKGVERWVEERVFPVLSNMLMVHNQDQDQDHPNPVAENYITLYIDTLEGTWELAFDLDYSESLRPTVAF